MKKTRIIAVILAVVTVMGCIFATTVSAEPEYKLGDVTLDTKITTADAKKTLRAVAQLVTLTDAEKLIADVNGDNRITTADAKLLLRYVAKLISEFPGEAHYLEIVETTGIDIGDITTEYRTQPEEPTTEEPTTEEPTTEEPTTEEPTTEEPTTEEPTTEEPTTEEPTTEPVVVDEHTVTEVPADITAFVNANFSFTGKLYDANGANDISVTFKDGNVRMGMDAEGIKMDIMMVGSDYYLISPENKTYHKLSKSEKKEFGVDELGSMTFSAVTDVKASDLRVYDATAFGKRCKDYRLVESDQTMHFYMIDGKLIGVETCLPDGTTESLLYLTYFSANVPDDAFSVKGYTNKIILLAFLTGIIPF